MGTSFPSVTTILMQSITELQLPSSLCQEPQIIWKFFLLPLLKIHDCSTFLQFNAQYEAVTARRLTPLKRAQSSYVLPGAPTYLMFPHTYCSCIYCCIPTCQWSPCELNKRQPKQQLKVLLGSAASCCATATQLHWTDAAEKHWAVPCKSFRITNPPTEQYEFK